MFEKFSHPDTLKRPMLKWLLLFLAVVLAIVVLISVFQYKRENSNQSQGREAGQQMEQEDPATKPLPAVDEALLQKQLQEIVATKEESDCDTLNDARYQLACHDFFRIQKEK